MKMQSSTLFPQLSEEKLKELTTEVKEVLAMEYKKDGHKVFSPADLWNIQRRQKRRIQRRHV